MSVGPFSACSRVGLDLFMVSGMTHGANLELFGYKMGYRPGAADPFKGVGSGSTRG